MLQYGNEGTKVLWSQSYIHSLSFLLMGDVCSASGSKETAHSNHRQYFGGEGGTSLPQSHISLLHLKLQLLWPWLQQHGTNTNVKQHSHALLNICINPVLRSPAQAHILEFKYLPLSQFTADYTISNNKYPCPWKHTILAKWKWAKVNRIFKTSVMKMKIHNPHQVL